jgi:hypothetical protein
MTIARHLLAALFVQADGCYSGRTDIDAWTEVRDARLYPGGTRNT